MNYLNFPIDPDLDQYIYRIMKQEHVISLFKDRTNVLSRMSNWKDKFENLQLRMGGILEGEAFSYGFKNDFVGQCWTRDAYSEAMWGIYANDPNVRFLRIRSTPRKLLTSLVRAHPRMPQDTCFLGRVRYLREKTLKARIENGQQLEVSAQRFAEALLLKRKAFKHEKEVRLLYLDTDERQEAGGLYKYTLDPHELVTQIMADPNRDRSRWLSDKANLQRDTGFTGEIKRSKIYDPPEWAPPKYRSIV
jgi:dipeptidyl aminopeptidase/acylaminoacyl peptidase